MKIYRRKTCDFLFYFAKNVKRDSSMYNRFSKFTTMSAEFTPLELRKSNRKNENFSKPTYGLFPGYFQANISIIPSENAAEFRRFCELNSSSCPVVYESKPGETACAFLSDDSDIRTDISAYKVFKDGCFVETSADLLFHEWSHMTTFYLGCSFSFDDKLVEAGVNLDFTANVSMYKTNVKCAPVGPFNANLVVSMRPIPKSLLQKVIEATIDLDFCHGAPVHIGRAKDIGIQMNSKVDFGSNVEIQQNYVPVFWACGVTGTEAVKSANLESTFTHSPGCMYVSDTLSEDIPSKITKTIYPKPIVVCLDDSLNRYSIISKQRYDTLSDIETICSDDVGNRGIETLTIRGDYHKAILSLSKSAKSVGIIVGFRCFTEGEPKEENDGVAGAIILARALVELGIDVCFFIDDGGEILKKTLLESSTQGFIGNKITVKTLGKDYDVHKVLINTETGLPNFTHLISIEKPCRSITGVYRTMKGRDISNECSELDKLFEKALEIPDIVTIGIGDGGNEIGMGKVKDKVIKHVEYGALIAAQTSCDYLIVCGVSDWGGYAISAGLYIARNCTVHDRYRRFGLENDKKICLTEEFFLSQEKDLDLRKLIRDRGFRDGITQIASLTVDNLSYEDVHLPKILSIQEKAKSTC